MLSKPSAERKMPVRLVLRAVDDGFELSVNSPQCAEFTKHMGTVPMIHLRADHIPAQKPPHENIIRQLSKLGDTVYTCSGVDIPDDFNYFIPNSVLSEMRRSLVEKLVSQGDGSFVTSAIDATKEPSPCDTYPYTYLYNISNRLSQQFYGLSEKTAYELKGGDGPIMQCRHCIRYALGYCVKHGGQRPSWH